MTRNRVEALAAVIKKRFPNLTVGEVLTIVFDLIEAMEAA
jgi:hypothetical protein